jgi:hypothetical protein
LAQKLIFERSFKLAGFDLGENWQTFRQGKKNPDRANHVGAVAAAAAARG